MRTESLSRCLTHLLLISEVPYSQNNTYPSIIFFKASTRGMGAFSQNSKTACAISVNHSFSSFVPCSLHKVRSVFNLAIVSSSSLLAEVIKMDSKDEIRTRMAVSSCLCMIPD